ncbi:hypothetical protein TWF730_006275 [Orbilia blumenaviensis]|uniref:F-box domain-containing protein n=1 Tax=Orbilia blumenaviensis TaxID=1796055 RepID=A0AAV9VFD1_9PEZI
MATEPRPSEQNQAGFDWANLPLDISHLILDTLDWPAHAICRQVCHFWRNYLDQPRSAAKRYSSPTADARVVHKVRGGDGKVVTSYKAFEPPKQLGDYPKQIHRILAEPGLAFFLYRNPKTHLVEPEEHCFFAPESRTAYKFRATKNETDLRGYFPDTTVGRITKIMFNPEYDEVDSDSDREGIDEYIQQPIGPWCLKMKNIPFAYEPVILQSSGPLRFLPRFLSLEDPLIYVSVREYLHENINNLHKCPTVGELVFGIGKVISRYLQYKHDDFPDGAKVFVSFRGIKNVRYYPYGLLAIEISVEKTCEWVDGDTDDEEEDAG